MRTATSAILLALGIPWSRTAAAPVPRPSKELRFRHRRVNRSCVQLEGESASSSFYSPVPHCQAFSKMLTMLNTEYSVGFQALGVAFEDATSPKRKPC